MLACSHLKQAQQLLLDIDGFALVSGGCYGGSDSDEVYAPLVTEAPSTSPQITPNAGIGVA